MIFKGRTGKEYNTLEPAIGKGGEGSIYKIEGMPDYVLKIFKDGQKTEDRHKKLLAMIVSSMPTNALQQVTWPIDVVYLNGQFAGYAMTAVKNNENLNVMYSDKYNCTLSEKIIIAKNLCSAVNAVHNAGQVCGDLNAENICVDPLHAVVTLVDTDSYHITDPRDSKVYRCEVARPEYLPKEVQEKLKNRVTLKTATLPTFSKSTDLFALAIHIFSILMNGCHPFACAVDNNYLIAGQLSVVQPIENICDGFFPFYNKRMGITIPQYAPDFSVLPKRMQDMFVRAFVEGHNDPSRRPDAVEWYNTLSVMQNNLKYCDVNRKHMYSNHLNECPWCKLENQLKVITMPQLTQTRINTHPYHSVSQPNNVNNNYIANNSTQTAVLNTAVSSTSNDVGKWIAVIVCIMILFSMLRACTIRERVVYSNVDENVQTHVENVQANNVAHENIETENAYLMIDVPNITDNIMSIDGITPNVTMHGNAEIVTYTGNMTYEGQVDEYSLIVQHEGDYRVDILGLQNESSVELYIYDENGEKVDSNSYCTNEEGITLKDLQAGHSYRISVKQDMGYSSYTLSIGMQKAIMDVTGFTQLTDSVEYTDQRNMYFFTVPVDGNYRFELSGMTSETAIELYIYNELKEKINSDSYCTNEEGLTVNDLNAGEVYEVQVCQSEGFGSYVLNIGYQKNVCDVSGYTQVTDSVEYTDQRNIYSFTVPVDGRYRFELSGMTSETSVELYMFNELGEKVDSDTYCTNGEGITVDDLQAGEVYEIQIYQAEGFGTYHLSIGNQKEAVEVSEKSIVNDNMVYTDQRNVYSFTPKTSEEILVTIIELESGTSVELYVFDEMGNKVASDNYCTDGEGVVISDVTVGAYYEIQVQQAEGLGGYALEIE